MFFVKVMKGYEMRPHMDKARQGRARRRRVQLYFCLSFRRRLRGSECRSLHRWLHEECGPLPTPVCSDDLQDLGEML